MEMFYIAYRIALGPTNWLVPEDSALLCSDGALSPRHHSVKFKLCMVTAVAWQWGSGN
jgi:hypothetical protein